MLSLIAGRWQFQVFLPFLFYCVKTQLGFKQQLVTFYSYGCPLVVKLLLSPPPHFPAPLSPRPASAVLWVSQTQAVCGPRESGDPFSNRYLCWNRGRKFQTLV